MTENYGRSMSGDFYDVVGGVGVRLGEIGDDYFVDASRSSVRVVTGLGPVLIGQSQAARLDQIAVLGSSRFQLTT
jgi:hypothetical protein